MATRRLALAIPATATWKPYITVIATLGAQEVVVVHGSWPILVRSLIPLKLVLVILTT